MKINKIFILAGGLLSCVLSLSSCSNDDDFTAGTPDAGSYLYANALSTTSNISKVYRPSDELVFSFSVGRTDASATETVALSSDNTIFSVPSSVTFAAGEKTKEIKVSFDIAIGTTEQVTFALSENTTAYGYSSLTFKITRDYNWTEIGKGVFISEFFGDEWEQPVLRAKENPNRYRLSDVYVEDYNMDFELTDDGQSLASPINPFETGYVDSSYGMVSARNLSLDKYPIEREGKTIVIPLQFIVSVGSFGWFYESITLP